MCINYKKKTTIWSLYLQAGKPPGDNGLNLEDWLETAEKRCQRAGDLRRRLEEERKLVLEKINARKTEKAEPKSQKENTRIDFEVGNTTKPLDNPHHRSPPLPLGQAK